MASCLGPLSAEKTRASEQRDQGKRPQGIVKAEPQVRRSTRILQLQKDAEDRVAEPASFTPPAGKVLKEREYCKTEEELAKDVGSNTSKNTADPIETWIQTKKWPIQYFEQDSQAGEDFFSNATAK